MNYLLYTYEVEARLKMPVNESSRVLKGFLESNRTKLVAKTVAKIYECVLEAFYIEQYFIDIAVLHIWLQSKASLSCRDIDWVTL